MKVKLQPWLPQQLMTVISGWLANCKITPIKNYFIQSFIHRFKVDLSEAEHTQGHEYANLNAFFTRRLQKNARPFDPTLSTWVSPADGTLAQWGNLIEGTLIQAKGKTYTLAALLGDTPDPRYERGQFATIYLAPHNYHRVHMPWDGVLKGITYIPGKLFSVSLETVAAIPNVFTRNERIVFHFESTAGPFSVVMVGALIVGGMSTPWTGRIPRGTRQQSWTYNHAVAKGAELGVFHIGSTVIVIFPEKFQFKADLSTTLQWGHTLGVLA